MNTQSHCGQAHIAMIGHKRIPSRESGVEVVVEQLATRLVEKGYAVDAYNRKNSKATEESEYRGIHIISIPTIDKKSLDAPIYAFFATIRACLKPYDVMHYHAEGSCIMLWLCKLFHKKTVVTIHGLDWQRAKWGGLASKVIRFGERCAVRYADEIVVLSKNIQRYFVEEYNRSTIYIPNGVNKPQLRNDKIIKKKYNLSKDNYNLYLGRIVPEKGLDSLIAAYKEIDTQMPLVIAGGSSHTDEYYKQLRESAKDDARIVFTGFVDGELLESLFSNAYLYVFPSLLEGMPLSLLEAMSFGNCCLVSDIPENVEVVKDNAYVFANGNVEELRCALTNLIQTPDLVTHYRTIVPNALVGYDWDKITERTIAVYRDAIKRD